jgi:microcystin-dependent protein
MPKITEMTADTSIGGAEILYVVDGSTDKKATTSQVRDYIIPAGSLWMFAGSVTPSGWMFCEGTAISRTIYASLFTAIGTTYGVGDGVTTFNIPDFREAAPVGLGTRGAGVTAHDVFTLGQFKDDQMQGHRHSVTHNANSGTFNGIGGAAGAGENQAATIAIGDPSTDGTNGTPRIGTVTRGKQVGTNFIIKF